MKVLKHLKTVLTHKWYVFRFCCHAGIPLRGILHDLSKFSPTEFIESVKYFTGTHSPIDECKKHKGYSMAWYHHRGRNKHHWEYWVDNFELGMSAPIIPYKYAIESICDVLGASRAYNKDNWSYMVTYKWWKRKLKTVVMHPMIKLFIDYNLARLAISNSAECLSKKNTKSLYNELLDAYERDQLGKVYSFFPEDLSEYIN